MSHFNQKISENSNKHAHVIFRSHVSHPHVKVQTMDKNKTINIKQSQLLTIAKQHATAHIKATGQYSYILSGGSVDISIREGTGFGHLNNVFLNFDIRNNSVADIEMVSDAGLWINYIELLLPNGSAIQNIYGKENLYEMTDVYTSKEWKVKSHLRATDKYWTKKNLILSNGETKSIYLDVLSSFFKACGVFLPALKGEIILRVWFHGSSNTLISGYFIATLD